jgi:hypothetical protein
MLFRSNALLRSKSHYKAVGRMDDDGLKHFARPSAKSGEVQFWVRTPIQRFMRRQGFKACLRSLTGGIRLSIRRRPGSIRLFNCLFFPVPAAVCERSEKRTRLGDDLFSRYESRCFFCLNLGRIYDQTGSDTLRRIFLWMDSH